ncbi:hypothetical protein PK69_21335 [Xanthomonas phaseoli pv. phaseoli]|uniref:Transposase n=1 Tax=Xanthomonas campestris pv. phaseoli TaxID=317013 RepID=A0AB34QEX2_XANCH|nr:hypothetical protein AC609_07475 [Xanthomonas phaseoli pv. phaseoli]AZU32517.1 hypothetical protein AC801_23025 [Xanthomonas sp. ISO98C4]AZU25315.1 hypothetical protein AC611_07480 [Xanthomonas phaseoli pv. phaseoli]AZU34083.1 hypothetical protein AC610_07470 [Xanthomonas phaseoli pv. phaseoli]KGT51671.1 hypothetical protein NZ02_08115 [Xanthomonas phaseoli pv. phaseoli]
MWHATGKLGDRRAQRIARAAATCSIRVARVWKDTQRLTPHDHLHTQHR